jgi:DNA-binding PadR family transcriptional regulator
LKEQAMADRRRSISNPLALAVLACLHERPMHPYEMASTMRERGKENSIKLNYGSLYTVVDSLAKHGLIEALEARREGRRPERTVYQLTEAGRARLDAWMSELIAEPVKEYPQFEAALSLLPVLHPDTVAELLRTRARLLRKEIARDRVMLGTAHGAGLPRLLLIEGEYHLALRKTELSWVEQLASELEAGTLEGLDGWRHVYETGEAPTWDVDADALERLREAGMEGGARPG